MDVVGDIEAIVIRLVIVKGLVILLVMALVVMVTGSSLLYQRMLTVLDNNKRKSGICIHLTASVNVDYFLTKLLCF